MEYILFISAIIASVLIVKRSMPISKSNTNTPKPPESSNVYPESSYKFDTKGRNIKLAPTNQKAVIHKNYIKATSYPNDFVVIDTETTGLSPATDQIIQLSAIKYINGEQSETYDIYINPGMSIPPSASRVNGIYDKDVANCPSIDKVLPYFIDFIGDLYLVAHNASFDMAFIQTALATHAYPVLDNPVIDTLSLARKYILTPNHKLETLKIYFKIDARSHNAIDDCLVTGYVYLYCKDHLQKVDSPKNYISSQNTPTKKEPNEFELECYKLISELLNSKGKDTTLLRHRKGSNYFDVQAFYTLCKIKASSKNKYVLIETKFMKFVPSDFPTALATKSEGAEKIRLLLTTPSDLLKLEELLIDQYDECIKSLNDYMDHVQIGKQNFQKYLNGTLF